MDVTVAITHALKSSPRRRPKKRLAKNRLPDNNVRPSIPIALAIFGPSAILLSRAQIALVIG